MAMKTEMTATSQQAMMGTRKIAEVTGKQHKHIVRDILAMLEQLNLYSPELDFADFKGFSIDRKEHNGRNVIDEIFLNESLSVTLVTGYDATRRHALIKQWREMKYAQSQPRITAHPSQQESTMDNNILSLARVVAEATASATMKAVIDNTGIQQPHSLNVTEPTPMSAQPPNKLTAKIRHHDPDNDQAEFVPVADLVWTCGFSDAACRRLATFAKLKTCLSNGERGHLLIHRESFMVAAQTLLDESTPPTGRLKRWQHPKFGGFTLKITGFNKANVEAR